MTAARDKLTAQRSWFAACKKAGLDDDARRAFQEKTCGQSSAKAMRTADFNACTLALAGPRQARDTRTKATSPHAAKARALWISLYHLGQIDDPRESALAAFCKRQAGVDDLRWLAPAQADKVIDALKGMATRAGVDWKAFKDTRRCVLAAQWAILTRLGAAPALDMARHLYAVTGAPGFFAATSIQLDQLIKDSGQRIRGTKKSDRGQS